MRDRVNTSILLRQIFSCRRRERKRMDDTTVIARTVASSASGRQLKPLPAPIARKPGDASPPMVCQQVFDSISIHANGDIVCWCVDVNGKHVYGNVFTDRIADVY